MAPIQRRTFYILIRRKMAEEKKEEEVAASRGEANFFLASKVGEESTVEAREHRGPRIQGV